MTFFSLVFMLTFSPYANADFELDRAATCTFVDNRNAILGSVRNQQEINWCYAFAGADLLSYVNHIDDKISAADMAIHYNQSQIGRILGWFGTIFSPLPPQTGLIKNAIDSYQAIGYCPESVMSSESWIKVTRTNIGWKNSRSSLLEAMKDINLLYKKEASLTSNTIPFYFSFKNVDLEVFLKLIHQNDARNFYAALSKTVCKNDRKAFPSKIRPHMEIVSSSGLDSVDHQLNTDRLASVDFDYRILEDKYHSGISLYQLHTALVVGRKWNDKTKNCQYLIRDSYGASCEDYDQDYECDKGNVWINEKSLLKNMTSILTY